MFHKFFSTALLVLCLVYSIRSQDLIEFSMGPGYLYDIYYSLDNGITAYPERANWDLAFATDPYDNNIRINSGAGVTLYQVSENINDWNQIFSIPSDAVQLKNSNIDWSMGAFVSNPSEELNYGWGNYNPANQAIEGTRIYIINYGPFDQPISKKIKINSLINGVFNFTIANLDGSSEENISIDGMNFSDKKFIYYSLLSSSIINREPVDWDMLFTKYEEEDVILNMDTMPYIVTGVLTNQNLTAQYDGILDVNPVFESLDLTMDINIIGYDWKEYNNGYTIVADRAYYILSQDQEKLYKIIFQTFSGGQNGNMSFLVEELNYPSVPLSEDNYDLNIFPNPSKGYININYLGSNIDFKLTDLNGRLLYSKSGSFLSIALNNLNNGLYIATISTNDNIFATKIIVNR